MARITSRARNMEAWGRMWLCTSMRLSLALPVGDGVCAINTLADSILLAPTTATDCRNSRRDVPACRSWYRSPAKPPDTKPSSAMVHVLHFPDPAAVELSLIQKYFGSVAILVAPASCRLSRGHLALAGGGGTPPPQTPGRRRYILSLPHSACLQAPMTLIIFIVSPARNLRIFSSTTGSARSAYPS